MASSIPSNDIGISKVMVGEGAFRLRGAGVGSTSGVDSPNVTLEPAL